MPTAKTWWWLGIGTTVAAAAGTGLALIYKHRDKPKAEGVPEGTGLPPVPPTPKPKTAGGGFSTEPVDRTREICRMWLVDDPVNFTPQLRAIIHDAIDTQISVQDPDWTSIEELHDQSFWIARAALMDVCPSVAVPEAPDEIDQIHESAFDWWKNLWYQFYNYAYNQISHLRA